MIGTRGNAYLGMNRRGRRRLARMRNCLRRMPPYYRNGWNRFRVRWHTPERMVRILGRLVSRMLRQPGAVCRTSIVADKAWRCREMEYPLVDWGGMACE